MNFNIRAAVLQNVKSLQNQELHDLVQDSIQQGEEKLLPGLGVLFETIWQNTPRDEQDKMIDTLQKNLSS